MVQFFLAHFILDLSGDGQRAWKLRKGGEACLLRLTLQGATHCCSNVNVYEGHNKILNGMNN